MWKVTNKTEAVIRFGDIIFQSKETKILEEKPTSDRFHVERVEEKEEPKKDVRRSNK